MCTRSIRVSCEVLLSLAPMDILEESHDEAMVMKGRRKQHTCHFEFLAMLVFHYVMGAQAQGNVVG